MRILNWNTRADKLAPGAPKSNRVRDLIAQFDADVICLTEAYPGLMPEDGQTISSELSDWEPHESRGARKVVLWSRFGWSNVDTLGAQSMPPGRFIKANTTVDGERWTIIGMCIPYAHYRNQAKWGNQRKKFWQGAGEYLDALSGEVLPRLFSEDFLLYSQELRSTILLGDFNMQIPAHNYPYEGSAINKLRKQAFDGLLIPTAGISRHFIDHVAMSTELRVSALRYISRYDNDSQLSDHNGVVLDLAHQAS